MLDRRPILVAVAGPNGAGKTTFYLNFIEQSGLRFINADVLAHALVVSSYRAAEVAATIHQSLLDQRESFVFETVFSDPAGDKLSFLKQAIELGYTVLLCFIGISAPSVSEQRVAMRRLQGGHDVPSEELFTRYPRVMLNLKAALKELPNIWVLDNEDLANPYQRVAIIEDGKLLHLAQPAPAWLKSLLPKQ